MIKNIMELLERNVSEGKARDETYRNMRLILNTNEKAENFLSYVKGMDNNCLELDCIAYRELVLNNRKYNIEITKEKLKSKNLSFVEKHKLLRNLLLEDLTVEEIQQFIKLSADDNNFISKFLDFWKDRKGIPFSKLLYMYNLLKRMAA